MTEPIPWSPKARTAVWIGILALLVLYAIGGIGFFLTAYDVARADGGPVDRLMTDGQARTTLVSAYGTTAFFATFGFVGFIVGIASERRPLRNALWVALGLLAPLLLMRLEGLLCIVMAIPLLLPELILGAWIGHRVRTRAHLNERQRAGLMALAFTVSAGWEWIAARNNDPAHHPLHRVETSATMAASPASIFEALQDITLQKPPPAWLKIGFPIPHRLRVTRGGLGGEVLLESPQMDIAATITDWQVDRRLAFTPRRYEIRDRPLFHTRLGGIPGLRTDPMTDWLTYEELSYDLKPLPNGRTQVTRVTTFRRHLFPDLYFGWLEPLVIEKGQAHLLAGIREQVETPVRPLAAQ